MKYNWYILVLLFFFRLYIAFSEEDLGSSGISFASSFSTEEDSNSFSSDSSSISSNSSIQNELSQAEVAGDKESFSALYSILQKQTLQADPKEKYKLGHVIGKGSKGVVLEAVHRSSGQKFAIKILHLNIRRNVVHALRDLWFLRRMASIPWVPTPIDSFIHKRHFYLVQTKVNGETLRNLSPHLVSDLIARRILFQVISMAAFLKRNGICHNDLSLSNLMIDRVTQRLFLIDFADSRLIYSDESLPSTISETSQTREHSTSHSAAPTLARFFRGNSYFLLREKDSNYQHLMINESECKDDFKLQNLIHNWIEKIHFSSGRASLKKAISQYTKGKISLQSILLLPFFSGCSFSDLIELRGSRRK